MIADGNFHNMEGRTPKHYHLFTIISKYFLQVMREITDSRARTREELEGLYRKIVSCVLLRWVLVT